MITLKLALRYYRKNFILFAAIAVLITLLSMILYSSLFYLKEDIAYRESAENRFYQQYQTFSLVPATTDYSGLLEHADEIIQLISAHGVSYVQTSYPQINAPVLVVFGQAEAINPGFAAAEPITVYANQLDPDQDSVEVNGSRFPVRLIDDENNAGALNAAEQPLVYIVLRDAGSISQWVNGTNVNVLNQIIANSGMLKTEPLTIENYVQLLKQQGMILSKADSTIDGSIQFTLRYMIPFIVVNTAALILAVFMTSKGLIMKQARELAIAHYHGNTRQALVIQIIYQSLMNLLLSFMLLSIVWRFNFEETFRGIMLVMVLINMGVAAVMMVHLRDKALKEQIQGDE